MGLGGRVNHKVPGKSEDFVDMAALWRHLVLAVFQDVIKAQLEPPVRTKDRKTRPLRKARIKEREYVAHAPHGIAGEFTDAADGEFERNKSLREISHRGASLDKL